MSAYRNEGHCSAYPTFPTGDPSAILAEILSMSQDGVDGTSFIDSGLNVDDILAPLRNLFADQNTRVSSINLGFAVEVAVLPARSQDGVGAALHVNPDLDINDLFSTVRGFLRLWATKRGGLPTQQAVNDQLPYLLDPSSASDPEPSGIPSEGLAGRADGMSYTDSELDSFIINLSRRCVFQLLLALPSSLGDTDMGPSLGVQSPHLINPEVPGGNVSGDVALGRSIIDLSDNGNPSLQVGYLTDNATIDYGINEVETTGGQKEYQCCDKYFTRKENWKAHMNSHSGLRPFECKYRGKGCPFDASARSTVTRHHKTCKFRDV